MNNIYRGEKISKQDFVDKLDMMKSQIEKDLLRNPLMPEKVIEAANTLSKEMKEVEVVDKIIELGISKWAVEEYVRVAIDSLSKDALLKKVHTELRENPFTWRKVVEGIEEKEHPLGVIVHIGAGNALGLSAFSVIEGLLTGNINILKLPENEGGLSSMLLMRLIEIEPLLKPYIYVLDVSSKDKEVICQLIGIANAVVVWGSDETIKAIRQLTPPRLPLIEWGHRLSFAYFTNNESIGKNLAGLARNICISDQLYCSSPQCVFYETDDRREVDHFANQLAQHMESIAGQYLVQDRPLEIQAQITWIQELIKMEELLQLKRLITDENNTFGVMVDYNPGLKASPLFRNIWVMPIKRENLFKLLRAHKGHLQTVGLCCEEQEFEELSKIFYTAGIHRITSCEAMSKNYSGEPHDGVYSLRNYVRIVNKVSI
ncbi:MAG: acyl-CoA reductase [Firmicutes bacterium HGW-Firmicutes-1]|jgi:hypothetical protein|nr:MAG: acyl-CoA reductase [Firmicutes bacterium HGW-Firmicutes-1]